MKKLILLLFSFVPLFMNGQKVVILPVAQPPELGFSVSKQDTTILKGNSSMIFLRALRQQLDPVDRNSERRVFDISYCSVSGDIVSGKVVCTSSSFVYDTFNFKFCDSGEIRTAHACLLLRVNNREVNV